VAKDKPPREPFSYDRMIKSCVSHFHLEIAAWLTGERPLEVREVDAQLAAAEERSADKLLWLTFHGKPDIALHLEFQVEGRKDMPERMARYLLLAGTTKAVKERGARLASFVVYLDRRTYHREDPGSFELPAAPGTSLRATYGVVKLWELDPGPILEAESPALCPFAPLLRGDPRELLVKSREKIVKASGALVPPGVKQDMLLLLGGLAGRVIEDRGFIQSVLSEIRDMGDNVFFDLIQEQAMEKGIEKGIERGIREGIEKGRAEEARRAVLCVLARRFGQAPEDLGSRLESVEALDRLERLLDEAVACQSLEDFQRVLAGA
jgi:hypothetical protein